MCVFCPASILFDGRGHLTYLTFRLLNFLSQFSYKDFVDFLFVYFLNQGKISFATSLHEWNNDLSFLFF
jgi:hypothetical protein